MLSSSEDDSHRRTASTSEVYRMGIEKSATKHFFIGAGKTGTTSIHKALKEKGLRTTQTPNYGVFSHLKSPDELFFSKFDYFLDGCFHNFAHLKAWYPDARFVLLDRPTESWVISLYNWLSRIDERNMKQEKLLVKVSRLVTGKWAYEDIVATWLVYKKRAGHFFRDDPHFIVINLEANGEKDWVRLQEFLGVELPMKWENRQENKQQPKWISRITEVAESKAEKASASYPSISHSSFRDRLFMYSMSFLSNNFIRERHLVKNIKEAFGDKKKNLLRGCLSACIHIGRFFWVVCCLVIRFFTNRSYRISPFVY